MSSRQKKVFKKLDYAESVRRTAELYQTKLALLQTWENHVGVDPDYLLKLKRQVHTYHTQLKYKGAL